MSQRRPGPRRGSRRPPPPARGFGKGNDARRGPGGEQVEGRQAVTELLAAGRRPVFDVWLASDAAQGPGPSGPRSGVAGPSGPRSGVAGPSGPRSGVAGPSGPRSGTAAPVVDRINELAAGRGVPVRRVTAAQLEAEARTEAPQGVLAHAAPLPDVDLDDLCRPRPAPSGGEPPPFLLALDGVTDPQNLGALLRTAEGAGVTGAVVPRHRAAHVTPAVTKAAAGAVEHVPIAVVGGLPAALSRARDLGLWILGLDPGADRSLFDLTLADQGVVVVLGAEGRGLSRLVRDRCDLVLDIPLKGRLPSLNVSAAGALALFEISRRRT